MSDEIEKAIEGYRAQLQAEADIGRSDLAEIEDHLRELVTELRQTGMPISAAITEAAHRLGDPRQLAREHARVRSAFGARLSRARAWSAATLVLAQLVLAAVLYPPDPFVPMYVVTQILLPAVVAGALAGRLTWARALILGMSGYGLVQTAMYVALPGEPGFDPMIVGLFTILQLGTFAFVMPWRRHEIAPAGIALVVLYVAFGGAMAASMFVMNGPFEDFAVAFVAQGATVLAGAGLVLRARWAAFAAVLASLALLVSAGQVNDIEFVFADAALIKATLLGSIALGSVAAAVTAVLSWRTARTRLGTLRSILS